MKNKIIVKALYPVVHYPKTVSLLVVLCICVAVYFLVGDRSKVKAETMNRAFASAEAHYNNRQFSKALHDYNSFLKLAEELPHSDGRVVQAVEHTGRIYLSIKHTPKMAIHFLNRFVDHPQFNELENEELHEWIAVAKQMLTVNAPPKETNDPNILFERGLFHFEAAMNPEAKIEDGTTTKHFAISESYLIELFKRFQSHEKIPQALYMLGVIDENILTKERAAEHFYFKEAIRRAPHTELAKKSYQHLYTAFHKENTTNGVDSTPEEIEESLKEFKQLAQ